MPERLPPLGLLDVQVADNHRSQIPAFVAGILALTFSLRNAVGLANPRPACHTKRAERVDNFSNDVMLTSSYKYPVQA